MLLFIVNLLWCLCGCFYECTINIIIITDTVVLLFFISMIASRLWMRPCNSTRGRRLLRTLRTLSPASQWVWAECFHCFFLQAFHCFFLVASNFNTLKADTFNACWICFGVSIIHQTLTSTAGSLVCICDLLECVYPWGGPLGLCLGSSKWLL